jgi:hypothetical protein
MAIAGRVAIVPKGEYSNAVTYDKLDLVMFNNDAYVAKKASTGIEPTNDEYWMLILNNVVAEDLEKIIDGTTPVGNANKLGGKGASEYALQSAVDKIQTTSRANLSTAGWYRVAMANDTSSVQKCDLKILRAYWSRISEIHTLSYEYGERGFCNIISKGSQSYSAGHMFTKARVTRDTSNTYFEVYYAFSENNRCAFTAIDGGYDNPWKAITPVSTSETVDGVSVLTTYDIPANATPATSADLANYLPNSGGLVSASDQTPIIVQNTIEGAKNAFIRYRGQYSDVGCLGFADTNVPAFIASDNATWYPLLHTGNKPSGSYTGNGSGTSRTISTGGMGDACIIYGSVPNIGVVMSYVTWGGAICQQGGKVSGIAASEGRIIGGNITLNSTSNFLNVSGVKYIYQVL